MEVTIPHYYKRFRCIASECPDTCCAGWAIMIDHKTLKKYKKIRGTFGRTVRASINWKEKSFRQRKGRCAFLNKENLCELYLEGGSDYFCRTCRRYPRHIEEFEDCREISLSLSCMAAARIILGSSEKVRFLRREIPVRREEDYKDFDYFLFTNLLDVRETVFEILQNRTMDAGTRSCMALALVHDFQGRIQGQRLGETQELLERYRKPETADWFRKDVEQYREGSQRDTAFQMFRILKRNGSIAGKLAGRIVAGTPDTLQSERRGISDHERSMEGKLPEQRGGSGKSAGAADGLLYIYLLCRSSL